MEAVAIDNKLQAVYILTLPDFFFACTAIF